MDIDGKRRTAIDDQKREISHEILDKALDMMAINKDFINVSFSNYGYDVVVHFDKGGFNKDSYYDFCEGLMFEDSNFVFEIGYVKGFLDCEIRLTKEEDEDGSGESDAD